MSTVRERSLSRPINATVRWFIDDVFVRKHHPLGMPRRARGIEQEGEVFLAAIGHAFVGRGGGDLRGEVARGGHVRLPEDEHLCATRCCVLRFDHAPGEIGRGHHEFCVAVVEHVADFLRAPMRRDGNDRSAELPHGLERSEDLRTIRHDHRHAIAALDAGFAQHGS